MLATQRDSHEYLFSSNKRLTRIHRAFITTYFGTSSKK
jgi:hypothetical protein